VTSTYSGAIVSVPPLSPVVGRTPGISCEAVPASDLDGAGMRRHVHPGNHAAESFVSFIPLFDGLVAPSKELPELLHRQAGILSDTAMVNAFTGLWRGIVRMRRPSDMTTCLPSRTTLNPAFSRARTA
jgi:hypothetical protein